MQSIISSEIFVITLVAGVYLAALWLYRKTKLALLHPLLVSDSGVSGGDECDRDSV